MRSHVLVLLPLLATLAAAQQVRPVPSPAYPTIAAAAMTASAGTVIRIAPGRYHETLADFGAALVFEGDPNGGTYVDGDMIRPSFLVTAASSLQDLHFRRGVDAGATAVALATRKVTMFRCSMRNCHATGPDAAVFRAALGYDLLECRFSGNSAILAVLDLEATPMSRLSRCVLHANLGARLATFQDGPVCSFDNSLVIDNVVAGTLFRIESGASVAITFDTVIYNRCQDTVRNLGPISGSTVNSCIIRKNLDGSGGAEVVNCGILYSNVNGVPAGNGNFDIDPTFFNQQVGNWRLHPFSVSIDTGRPPVLIDGVRDLDGYVRNVGVATDQGCYEYGGPDPGPAFDGTATTYLPQVGDAPILRVNGWDGGRNHVVPIMAGQTVQISVQQPDLMVPANFTIWGQFGFPDAFNPITIPHNAAGQIVVRPQYLDPLNPALFTFADTIVPTNGLHAPTLAPWAVTSIAMPLMAPVALQGVVEKAGGGWEITNCVVIFVGPS